MSLKNKIQSRALGLLGISLLTFPVLGQAQTAAEEAAYKANPIPLVRDASFNELHTDLGGKHPFRYRLRKTDEKGITTKEIIETSDGDVARLMSRDDKPLPADAEKAEMDRLDNLLAHPEIQVRRHKKEQEDSGRADTMIKLLPDAFTYTYLGVVQGLGGPAYRLSFVPNPNFVPPSREAQVYHGMAGELWIDVREKRMAKFDAHLISDVDFAWGFAARLDKGGTILVEQKDVGDGHWEAVNFKLNLTGKILMMKTLDMKTLEEASDFVAVPPGTGVKEAVAILKTLPADK
jgi:hypothetical protein